MRTFLKMVFITAFLSSAAFAIHAQQKSGKLTVYSRLQEKVGTYDQRKLYREFLTDYMKDCPFISHFHIEEALNTTNNHDVIWTYEVNNWDDITQFYGWVNRQLKLKEGGLKKALTPYQPDYAIGGQIRVEKTSDEALSGKNASDHKNHVKNGG